MRVVGSAALVVVAVISASLVVKMLGERADPLGHSETVHRLRIDVPNLDELSPFSRVDIVRDWVYAQTDVSATRDRLLDQSDYPLWRMDLDEVFDLYGEDVGGVWCSGAATGLRRVYEALGYRAWVLSYGILGRLTHAVTVVEVEGDLYLEDAYFNRTYVDASGRHLPLYEIVRLLKRGEPLSTADGARTHRDVHLASLSAREANWTTRGQGDLICRSLDGAGVDTICRAQTFARNFTENAKFVEPAYEFLVEAGYPRDLDYLLLFPYGISGLEGYVTEPEESKILSDILAISGHLGG